MKITTIYKKYRIMPQLEEHQLKVAAVADLICQNFKMPLNREQIVTACLLHDMGNIIKFNLDESKTLLNQDLDVEYWKKVQAEFLAKYGNDEHLAHLAILKELGVKEEIQEMVDAVGFENAKENLETESFGKKICAYCDMRVSPKGVVSLEQRFADLRKRYAHRHTEWGAEEKRREFEQSLREIEKQIFAYCQIKPEGISEQSAATAKQKLADFEISTKNI